MRIWHRTGQNRQADISGPWAGHFVAAIKPNQTIFCSSNTSLCLISLTVFNVHGCEFLLNFKGFHQHILQYFSPQDHLPQLPVIKIILWNFPPPPPPLTVWWLFTWALTPLGGPNIYWFTCEGTMWKKYLVLGITSLYGERGVWEVGRYAFPKMIDLFKYFGMVSPQALCLGDWPLRAAGHTHFYFYFKQAWNGKNPPL